MRAVRRGLVEIITICVGESLKNWKMIILCDDRVTIRWNISLFRCFLPFFL